MIFADKQNYIKSLIHAMANNLSGFTKFQNFNSKARAEDVRGGEGGGSLPTICPQLFYFLKSFTLNNKMVSH